MKTTKIAVLPDIHCPFHDKKAVNLAIQVIKDFEPDILVQIGDLADFYALSAHRKNPSKSKGFLHELNQVLALMDELDDLAPRKIFTEGNHCNRLQRYLFDRAPDLYGYFDIKMALQLDERGWEYYPYQEVVEVGKVSFVHDLGFAGVNGTRQTLQAYPGDLIYGHTHRFNCYTGGNLKKQTYTCWNIGWLGDPAQIDYLPSVKVKQDWVKGFMLLELTPDGYPYYMPVKINNGKCLVNGTIYTS